MRRFLSVLFLTLSLILITSTASFATGVAKETPKLDQAIQEQPALEKTTPAIQVSDTNPHVVKPQAWAHNFQEAASPVAERLHSFHTMLLVIITAIVVFVTGLLLYVMIRFNEKANPVPSKTTHNVMLEVLWTMIPVLILVVVAVPSYKLLFYMDRAEKPEMTLKITGYQWYWGFQYPDYNDLEFTSVMVPEKDLKPAQGQVRLLSTDQPVVLPVDTDIQLLVTAADVLHAFAMPAFGVKTDAVPGRTNESWVRITKPGIYYGQCSELCGKDHAFMPVEVHAVTKAQFKAWIDAKKIEKDGGIEAKSPYQQITLTQ